MSSKEILEELKLVEANLDIVRDRMREEARGHFDAHTKFIDTCLYDLNKSAMTLAGLRGVFITRSEMDRILEKQV